MAEQTQSNDPGAPGLPIPEVHQAPPLLPHQEEVPPTASSIMRPGDSPSDSEDTEYRWKFSEETHRYVREYIKLADQKAIFFFAGSTAILAYLNSVDIIKIWLESPMQWDLIDMLSFVATIGLAISALFSIVTVFPRTRGSRRGIVFFGGIAGCTDEKEYVTEVTRHSVAGLLERKLSHVHELAKICDEKYTFLRIGLVSGVVGAAAAVFLLPLV